MSEETDFYNKLKEGGKNLETMGVGVGVKEVAKFLHATLRGNGREGWILRRM